MRKSDTRDIVTLMKRYDPLLLAAAIGDAGIESGLLAEEVANIKAALSKFDPREVARAAAEYIGNSSVVFSCGGPVCTCPEDGGCGRFTIRSDVDQTVYRLGASMFEAVSALDEASRGGVVVGVGDRLGYAGLCIDSVKCFGRQIYVMHGCMHSLYAFDIKEGVIDPVDAIVTIAKSNPALSKRVNAMVKEMEKAGELPG